MHIIRLVALSLCLVMISFTPSVYGQGYRSTLYLAKPLCDLKEKLQNGCVTHFRKGEPKSKCNLRCTEDDDCVGVSVDAKNDVCYFHIDCGTVSNCTTSESDVTHYEKVWAQPLVCKNGVWNEELKKCICKWWWVGLKCDENPVNCHQIGEHYPGLTISYYNSMTPPGSTGPIRVFCYSTYSDAKTVLAFNDGTTLFNETWNDYYFGFFSTRTGPYWIGLEKMYAIMGEKEWELQVRYTFKDPFVPRHVIYTYSGVVLGDASTNFTIRFSSYTLESSVPLNTSDHCLSQSNMTAFTTKDADHDSDLNENCAEKANAGWWFSACNFSCNPLGIFPNTGTIPPTEDGYIRLPGFDQQTLTDNLKQVWLLLDY